MLICINPCKNSTQIDQTAMAAAGVGNRHCLNSSHSASMTDRLAITERVAYLDAVVLGIGNNQPVPAVYDHYQRKVELAYILSQLPESRNVLGRGQVNGEQRGVAASKQYRDSHFGFERLRFLTTE